MPARVRVAVGNRRCPSRRYGESLGPESLRVGRAFRQTYVERRIERETACSLHNLRDLLEEDSHLMDRNGTDTNAT